MTVYLVGVGPGDPDLMTIRAVKLLSRAEAVVYDRLIGDEILDSVADGAERYPVGKTPGRPGPSQTDINELLVQLGYRLNTVVRVKGGDPFIFGRGREESDRLLGAGISVEVVPGISSALAAPMAAGISVTERGVSSGVCIVTAHQGPAASLIDWSAIAQSGLTVVVLMGAARASQIRDRLIEGGLSHDTPAAVVTSASRLDQRTWTGDLSQLGVTAVASPSVLVVGEAARPGALDHHLPDLTSNLNQMATL